jgi:hypothetical protein
VQTAGTTVVVLVLVLLPLLSRAGCLSSRASRELSFCLNRTDVERFVHFSELLSISDAQEATMSRDRFCPKSFVGTGHASGDSIADADSALMNASAAGELQEVWLAFPPDSV